MDKTLIDTEEILRRITRLKLLSQSLKPSLSIRVIKYGCIAVNAAIFLAWQFALREPPLDHKFWAWLDRRLGRGFYLRVKSFLERNFMFSPGDEQRRPWTLITSAFSHRDNDHFAANMITFTSFYDSFAWAISPVSMVGLVASTAITGSLGLVAQERRRRTPNRFVQSLGFSGVCMGMGVASTILFPHRWVRVYGVSMPRWAATAGFLAFDAFFLSSTTSRIGHASHIGGGIAGAIFALLLKFFDLVRRPRLLF